MGYFFIAYRLSEVPRKQEDPPETAPEIVYRLSLEFNRSNLRLQSRKGLHPGLLAGGQAVGTVPFISTPGDDEASRQPLPS